MLTETASPSATCDKIYTHDHLGSTRGVFGETGGQIGGFGYTPYGGAFLAHGPQDITRRFTGHHLDPLTGDYFAPFRYLSPGTARWLKRDPLGMVDGPNMYKYVGNNPINNMDPLGLVNWWWPLNGAVTNNTGRPIKILKGGGKGKPGTYHDLAPGESSADLPWNSDDVDGYWDDGKFYNVPGGEDVIAGPNGPEGESPPKPWDPNNPENQEGPSPEDRGAPDNKDPSAENCD